MSKKPIVIYWSPYINDHTAPDWSYLFPKPVSLFNDHVKYKNKDSKSHLFMCPASATKMKKTLVFNSPMTFSYQYDFTEERQELGTQDKQSIYISKEREAMLTTGPTFKLGLAWSFFASESLEASFTSPFFHKAKYMESCATVPGNFDIGQWYRPFSFEIQTWSEKGNINFIEGEPLFYAEFKTDRPIIIKRYNQTELLTKYAHSNMRTPDIFGFNQTLKSKYDRFRSIGMREKILHEIEKNVFEEEPLQL
jgi:hypothetical protein